MNLFLYLAMGFLLIVGLAGCSSEAKEEKPAAKSVPPYVAPKSAPTTPADKAAAKKVGFQ